MVSEKIPTKKTLAESGVPVCVPRLRWICNRDNYEDCRYGVKAQGGCRYFFDTMDGRCLNGEAHTENEAALLDLAREILKDCGAKEAENDVAV